MLFVLILYISANIPSYLSHGDFVYEYESTSKSCFPLDTCKSEQVMTCKCDNHCVLYGDCCADAPHRSNQRRKSPFLCRKKVYYDAKGIYVKNVCPTRNVESWVRDKCEGASFPDDIELQVPVFSSRSSISYRNYYCAVCNDDDGDLIFWDVAFSCKRLVGQKKILENLAYNDREGSWGFWDSSNVTNIWVPCKISPQFSTKISHYRECTESISECQFQWRNEDVRNMCHLYESRLVLKNQKNKIYKNLHCALCNGIDVKDLECPTEESDFTTYVYPFARPGYGYGLSAPGRIPIVNFRDIIDINLNKGNKIRKVKECPNGKIYDEVFDKCIQTFCIGNRIPRGGKCVAI